MWWGSGPFPGPDACVRPQLQNTMPVAGVVPLAGERLPVSWRQSRRQALRPPRAATGDRRASAARQTASSAWTPSARAPRRQGPSLRSVRFAALGLDAGSARATDRQLSDDASLRSRTTRPRPGRRASPDPVDGQSAEDWTIGESMTSTAAQHIDHDPNSTPTRSARSDPRTRQPTDENTDGHQ